MNLYINTSRANHYMQLPWIYIDIFDQLKAHLFYMIWFALNLNQLSERINFSNVLTILTIAISALSLIFSLSKDRALRQKENADKIRDAAATIMAKLDRWLELSLSIFQESQPLFINTIEMLKAEFNKEEFDIEDTRNYLWKNMIRLNNEISKKILDEDLQAAHNNLFGNRPLGHQPLLIKIFELKLNELEVAKNRSFDNFLSNTQDNVRAYDGRKKYDYKTNDLWNGLIETAKANKEEYEKNVKPIFSQLNDLLLDIIKKEDGELLDSLKLFDEHYFDRFLQDNHYVFSWDDFGIYVFSWDEIPGKDNETLSKFLTENFNIDWIKTAKIEKINRDNIINIYTEKNSIFLKLNDKKNEVDLEIDGVRTDTFKAKNEMNKLNIYYESYLVGKPQYQKDSAMKCYTDSRDYVLKSFNQFGVERINNLKKALYKITEATVYDPQYCDAFIQKGDILYKLDDYNGALEAYNQAISINKTSETLRQKGAVLIKMERYDEAIPILQESCDLDETNFKAREQLMRCYEQQMWHRLAWNKDSVRV
jgi:tetratricopeptide (TPR) repeat protein